MLSSLFLIVAISQSSIDDKETVLELANADGGLSASVKICVGPFVIVDHWYSLKKLSPDTGHRVFIDGRFAYGLGGTDVVEYPSVEVKWIEVRFNEDVIKLPKEAYSDTFELSDHLSHIVDTPYYGPRETPHYFLWVSEDKQLLRLKAMGSDGTGGYRVIWTVHRDGKWSRSFHYGP